MKAFNIMAVISYTKKMSILSKNDISCFTQKNIHLLISLVVLVSHGHIYYIFVYQ